MSASKDNMFNELEKESLRMEHMCISCGDELTSEAIDAGRDQCFDCYAEHQG